MVKKIKNFLVCLVGLPASGKTTFANKLKNILEKRFNDFKVKIVDPDKIRDIIAPEEFEYKEEQKVRKKNLEAVRKALKKGFVVISDNLNYYTSMRHDLKKIAENLSLRFFIIHISTPLEICLKWNEDRGTLIPNEVIEKIYNKFDNFGKYNWDYPIEKYDMSLIKNLDEHLEKLVDVIIQDLESLNDVINIEKEKKRRSNFDNEKLDKITRNIIGELLRNPNNRSFKNKLIKYRKSFVKANLNKFLSESEISNTFKDYLEKSLNTRIS